MRFSTKCWSEHILSAYKATRDLKHPLYNTFNVLYPILMTVPKNTIGTKRKKKKKKKKIDVEHGQGRYKYFTNDAEKPARPTNKMATMPDTFFNSL